MKKILTLTTFALLLSACSNDRVSTLESENDALKTELDNYRILAEQEAENARIAEANAIRAMQQAEREKEAAQMAEARALEAMRELEKCKGK